MILFHPEIKNGILLVEETMRDPHFQTRSTITRLAGVARFFDKGFPGNRFSSALTLENLQVSDDIEWLKYSWRAIRYFSPGMISRFTVLSLHPAILSVAVPFP